MTEEVILALGRQTIMTVLVTVGPLMLLGLGIGLLVSIFQATTQIHEQTLAFVPKILVTFLGLLFLGPWMLTHLKVFAVLMLEFMPEVIR